MKNSVISAAMLAGFLMASVSLFAHHGTGVSYDMHKVVVLKGVAKEFVFQNPHSQLFFDVTDEKGNVVHWVAEAGAASAVSTTGWTKNAVQPGDVITIYLNPVKNGRPLGRANKVVLADGTTFTGYSYLGGDRPSQCDKEFGPGGHESEACRPDGRKTTNKQ